MANTKNKQPKGLMSKAYGVAKKFSTTGLQFIDQAAPQAVSNAKTTSDEPSLLKAQLAKQTIFAKKKYEDPQQMLREHLPSVSRQLLGRHFNTVNQVAHFVAPQLSDKVSDYFFEQINDLTNQMSSVDSILSEVGAQELEELTQDVDRSKRISNALAEHNKWLAAIQGALSGATGIIGSAVDIPASLIMALRVIYQVGRSYGFDLNKASDQDVVQYIFKQVDLGVIAEKQAVLLAVKTLANSLKTHDLQSLQNLAGTNGDLDSLRGLLVDANGQFKWQWLNHMPKMSILERAAHLSPVVGAGIGAVYSWRLVEDVNHKAQQIFSTARAYVLEHGDEGLGLIAAYEKAMEKLQQATSKIGDNVEKSEVVMPQTLKMNEDVAVDQSDTITSVRVVAKTELQTQKVQPQVVVVPNDFETTEDIQQRDVAAEVLQVERVDAVHEGIAALADQWVENSAEHLEIANVQAAKNTKGMAEDSHQDVTNELDLKSQVIKNKSPNETE